eukprot:6454878-Amphidinium_carterae.1
MHPSLQSKGGPSWTDNKECLAKRDTFAKCLALSRCNGASYLDLYGQPVGRQQPRWSWFRPPCSTAQTSHACTRTEDGPQLSQECPRPE